ncbi:MAG: gamma-glutamyl-gamma-aminobutyrate hydrolase family protein [Candidatus Poseidoniales archaeon]|jgi:putative glutamine amidotransferase|tara:strand:- start:1024 stop:1743 length:720 start_codon:yes stop_codon:yes gene_type:complete
MSADNDRPIIGITCCIRESSFAKWKMDAAILPSTYTSAIEKAGGIPLLLPPSNYSSSMLSIISGLVIAGGPDINSEKYGQQPDPTASEYYPLQDESEISLIKGALEMDMPLLCICRGMQLLSIIHGGHLHQHLDTTPGYENHGAYDGKFSEHEVITEKGSKISSLMGENIIVNSTHHQGVANAGTLIPVGHAKQDGLIEAVERQDLKFCIGVQWHPERMNGEHEVLYSELVKSAKKWRK